MIYSVEKQNRSFRFVENPRSQLLVGGIVLVPFSSPKQGITSWCRKQFYLMAIDSIITSPHRRSQTQTAFSSPSTRKQHSRSDELGSRSTLVQRHRFLLTALALLAFLCTIYLYFAVTLGSNDECSELTGARKATCRLKLSKESLAGKLKFL